MSVRLSVRQSQKPLSLSELLLLTIEPIDHLAYWPSSLSTIDLINHCYEPPLHPWSLLCLRPPGSWGQSVRPSVSRTHHWVDIWNNTSMFQNWSLKLIAIKGFGCLWHGPIGSLPEGSVWVCANLIVEIEESVQLIIVKDVIQEVSLLVPGLCETVNVVKTVQHEAHRGVGDLVLAYLVAITAESVTTF